MAYTREQIIEKVTEALQHPTTLYSQPVFNYLGSVNSERYTEIAAREISSVHNLPILCGIQTITRQSSYMVSSHAELARRDRPNDSNRDEEWLAISMYGKTYDHIGKILDFQTPLKDKSTDEAGKIDLLSYNENENIAYILELKKAESKETLLRCILEAFTYWKTADKEKLPRDFGIVGAELRKAVLVFRSCTAYAEYHGDDCLAVRELMGKLGIDIFVLDEDGNSVIEAYKH